MDKPYITIKEVSDMMKKYEENCEQLPRSIYDNMSIFDSFSPMLDRPTLTKEQSEMHKKYAEIIHKHVQDMKDRGITFELVKSRYYYES